MPLWKGHQHSVHSSRNKTDNRILSCKTLFGPDSPSPSPPTCNGLSLLGNYMNSLLSASVLITLYPRRLRKVILQIWLSPLFSLILHMNVWCISPLPQSSELPIAPVIKVLSHTFVSLYDLISSQQHESSAPNQLFFPYSLLCLPVLTCSPLNQHNP